MITIYTIFFVVTTLISFFVAFFAWQRKSVKSAKELTLLMIGAGIWTFFVMFETAATSVAEKSFWSGFEYIGGLSTPILYLIFVFRFTGNDKFISTKYILPLFIIPAITLVLAITNEKHHLIWTGFSSISEKTNMMIYYHGIGYWIGNVAYSYLVFLLASVLLLKYILTQVSVFRLQGIFVLIAGLCPWIFSLVYISGINIVPGLNITPASIILTGSLFAFAIFYTRILDLVPVARKMLVETMPYGILVLDNQNRIQDINGVGLSFLGILNKNVIGFPVESTAALYTDLMYAALRSDSIDKIKINHANGFKIFSINKYAIEKTQGSRLIVLNDITKHILAEEEIKQKNEELQKVNAEKDKFFSIISHDLKSPFHGMLGLLESLANDYSDFSEDERKIIIQSSHHSAAKAYKLLNELLEWSRLQNNKVEIKKETVNLKEIIQGNIDVLGSAAEKKEISILNKINQNTFATLDVNSINTVVRNLLNNAIKFTRTGGSIEISVEQFESSFELSVADTGVGMSDETISKLFRLDESITMPGTNNEKGTGLGLTICNDIVKLNGWKMTLESQLGKGTTFRVLLPIINNEDTNTLK